MEYTDLDKQYLPKMWTKRFQCGDDALTDHFRFIELESDYIRKTIPFETLCYGTDACESLDLYGPDLPDGLYFWYSNNKTLVLNLKFLW